MKMVFYLFLLLKIHLFYFLSIEVAILEFIELIHEER